MPLKQSDIAKLGPEARARVLEAIRDLKFSTPAILQPEQKKPNKYRNEPQIVEGIRFDSKKEARRYKELVMMQRAGEITGLQVHPVYPLKVEGKDLGRYVGDFSYTEIKTGRFVLEDVKGVKTAIYKQKKKLVKILYGLDIQEV